MTQLIACFLILSLIINSSAETLDFAENYGKSFIYFSTLFRPTSPEMLTPGRGFLSRDECDRHRLSVTFAYGSSTNSNKIAAYFLPNGKSKILTGELGSDAVKSGKADVIASYFNVFTADLWTDGQADALEYLDNYSFESSLCFKPKQKIFGTAITYRYQLSCELDKGFWFEIVLPYVWVQNNLNFTEKVLVYGGPTGKEPKTPVGSFENMTQALSQYNWLFGRIGGAKNKGGIADIQLKLGYTYLDCLDYHLASFLGIILPTSNVPRAEYLWEPIYGDQNQFAFMSSFSGGFKIWSNNCNTIYWEIDTCGIYYSSNYQTRMIDLKNRPWSRYLWVYPTKNTIYPQQGINFTTQRVEVNQGLSIDLNTAFVFNKNNFNAEFGYHVYAKEAEKLKFIQDYNSGAGVAAIIKDDKFVNGLTKDNATINLYNEIQNDRADTYDKTTGISSYKEVFRPLTQDDFDLRSAACPAIFSNTFYFTIANSWGKNDSGNCAINQLLLGVSYEFVKDVALIDRWMCWLKWAFQF